MFWPWQVRRSVKVTCVFGVGITVRLSRACRLYRNTWWTSVTAKFSLRRCLPWNLLTFMITGERSADVYTVYLENICTSFIFATLAPHCQWPNLRLDKFYWITNANLSWDNLRVGEMICFCERAKISLSENNYVYSIILYKNANWKRQTTSQTLCSLWIFKLLRFFQFLFEIWFWLDV